MDGIQKTLNIIYAVLCFLIAIILLVQKTEGYWVVLGFCGVFLTIRGIRNIIDYFSMFIYMVDGKRVLFTGLAYLSMGFFTTKFVELPTAYMAIYMAGVLAIDGVKKILNAFELRRNHASAWKAKAFYAAVVFPGAVIVLINHKRPVITVTALVTMFVFTGIAHIRTVIKANNTIYIQ